MVRFQVSTLKLMVFSIMACYHIDAVISISINYMCLMFLSKTGYYWASEKNTLCSADEGSAPVLDKDECLEALPFLQRVYHVIKFDRDGDWSGYPKGCFFNSANMLYWNKHSTGGAHGSLRQICRSSGKLYKHMSFLPKKHNYNN